MLRLFLFYIAVFSAVYFVVNYFQRKRNLHGTVAKDAPSRARLRAKVPKGVWVQVYDTDSLDDAKRIEARLEEEELDCILYEQGRKDVHGNSMKGFGIAVSKSSVSRAQNVISRMPA